MSGSGRLRYLGLIDLCCKLNEAFAFTLHARFAFISSGRCLVLKLSRESNGPQCGCVQSWRGFPPVTLSFQQTNFLGGRFKVEKSIEAIRCGKSGLVHVNPKGRPALLTLVGSSVIIRAVAWWIDGQAGKRKRAKQHINTRFEAIGAPIRRLSFGLVASQPEVVVFQVKGNAASLSLGTCRKLNRCYSCR